MVFIGWNTYLGHALVLVDGPQGLRQPADDPAATRPIDNKDGVTYNSQQQKNTRQ